MSLNASTYMILWEVIKDTKYRSLTMRKFSFPILVFKQFSKELARMTWAANLQNKSVEVKELNFQNRHSLSWWDYTHLVVVPHRLKV